MRHQVEYLIVTSMRVIIWLLPRRLVLAGGTALGWVFYALDGSRRRLALANLAAALPFRSPGERRAIARATFVHFGRYLLDLIKLSSMPGDRLMALVEFEGDDTVERAYSQGRGVIFCTGHFGFWELQAIAHAFRFEPMAVVSRTLDNPRLDALLECVRTRCGTRVIYRRGAIRRVLRELAGKRGVGMLIDQHIHHSSAVNVDFFNRPAATTSAHREACAPDRRPGRSAVLAADAGRPVPAGLRARSGAAEHKGAGGRPRIHPALHRRVGNVRPALSAPLVVDASSLARCGAHGGTGR